jgi:hypothetical protein
VKNQQIKLIHVGKYAAEVEVTLQHEADGWAPYISVEDARKLDKVKQYLTETKIDEARALAKVFELKPV